MADDATAPATPTSTEAATPASGKAWSHRSGEAPAGRGPLSLLTGSLTSALFALLAWGLVQRLVQYYASHPIHYDKAIAQSLAVALKTLILGSSVLALFSFSFIALGLLLRSLQRLLQSGAGQASDPVSGMAGKHPD
ncbi:MAG: DUF3082 domain-containing protein [Aphanocapsa feldmannii 288cV]|nr:MAG: DUF3082 domain-containing protein [Aphanocapsa feldmannii 288cV]